MANKPLCSDDADTTRRLAALEAAVQTLVGGNFAAAIQQLQQDVSDLDGRVTALEGAG